jgi:xylulokinase
LADPHREAVEPVLSWQDTRAADEARELADRCGAPDDAVGTHLPWGPSYLPAKLLWIARHRPAGLHRTRWLLQPKDYLAYLLTGEAATDLWSSKGLCRVDDGTAVAEVFAAAGVDPKLLPPRRDPWQAMGVVDAEGADRTGLRIGTPVAVGWSDALAGMLALGVFQQPRAFVLTGTSDIAGISHRGIDGPCDAAGAADNAAANTGEAVLHIPATCAPLPVRYGPTQASGASLVWLAHILGREPNDVAQMSGHAQLEAVPRFLPYLDGERAPIWRPEARGILQGLSLATGSAELARAVMRGVALSGRHVIETAMRGDGLPKVHLGGAAAATPEWVQVRLEGFRHTGTPAPRTRDGCPGRLRTRRERRNRPAGHRGFRPVHRGGCDPNAGAERHRHQRKIV